MIVVVQTGVKHQHRNVVLEKRIEIGVGFDCPREIESQAERLVLKGRQTAPTVAAARAEQDEVPLAEPADHVEVHHCRHVVQGNGGIGRPMLRSQEALFLGVPGREEDRPLGAGVSIVAALANSRTAELPLALSSAPG